MTMISRGVVKVILALVCWVQLGPLARAQQINVDPEAILDLKDIARDLKIDTSQQYIAAIRSKSAPVKSLSQALIDLSKTGPVTGTEDIKNRESKSSLLAEPLLQQLAIDLMLESLALIGTDKENCLDFVTKVNLVSAMTPSGSHELGYFTKDNALVLITLLDTFVDQADFVGLATVMNYARRRSLPDMHIDPKGRNSFCIQHAVKHGAYENIQAMLSLYGTQWGFSRGFHGGGSYSTGGKNARSAYSGRSEYGFGRGQIAGDEPSERYPFRRAIVRYDSAKLPSWQAMRGHWELFDLRPQTALTSRTVQNGVFEVTQGGAHSQRGGWVLEDDLGDSKLARERSDTLAITQRAALRMITLQE
jgi:hypothetical protein